MNRESRNPMVMVTFFVLCLATWVVLQAGLGSGRLSPIDIFWVIAFLLIVFVFRARVRNERKALGEEAQIDPADDG